MARNPKPQRKQRGHPQVGKDIKRVHRRAVSILGSSEKADRWLMAPNRALGGATPNELLDSAGGGRQVVRAVLVRIEHGVFG